MSDRLKIALCVGELSGDEAATELVRALQRFSPSVSIRGMGGRNMREAGVETIVDSEKSGSVMGLGDVLGAFGGIWNDFQSMKRLLNGWRPHVLVLIDYPDFNLRLAKYAHSIGIKTFYYITPQVWAWRSWRVGLFRKYITHAAPIFPFEKEFFRSRGYSEVTYVGHPFATKFADKYRAFDRNSFRQSHGLNADAQTVCIFPGSREQEVKLNLQAMLDTFSLLRNKHPEIQGVLSVASSLKENSQVRHARLPEGLMAVEDDPVKILLASDVGLIKSGTSNLQAAFCGLPFVMFYRATWFGELVVRLFVKVREYSIVNVIRPQSIIELVQDNATPERASEELEKLIFDKAARKGVISSLHEVQAALSSYDDGPQTAGCASAAERAALALTLLFK